jgi:hypothetical protein
MRRRSIRGEESSRSKWTYDAVVIGITNESQPTFSNLALAALRDPSFLPPRREFNQVPFDFPFPVHALII